MTSHSTFLAVLGIALTVYVCHGQSDNPVDVQDEDFKDLECSYKGSIGLCWPEDDCNTKDGDNLDTTCKQDGLTAAICCPIEDKPTNPDVSDRTIAGRPSIRRFVNSHRPRRTSWTNQRLPTGQRRPPPIWRPGLPGRPAVPTPTRRPAPRPAPVADRLIKEEECARVGGGVIQPLITEGIQVPVSSYPFIGAFIQKDANDLFCGGSLISKNYVLTAAHCVDRRKVEEFYIRFRDSDLTSTTESRQPPVEINPESIIRHPSYTRATVYNDIALVKLSRSVTEPGVVPVCLASPTLSSIDNRDAAVLGYGSDGVNNDSLRKLMKAVIKIAPADDCKEAYQNSARLPQGIAANLICAGDVQNGRDACRGDSGGPLVLTQGLTYYQVGVVAAGRDCGKFHGLYTRVSFYHDWIITNTKN